MCTIARDGWLFPPATRASIKYAKRETRRQGWSARDLASHPLAEFQGAAAELPPRTLLVLGSATAIEGRTMKRFAAVLFAAAALIAAQCASAEDRVADVTDMQALRTAVRTDKKAFVASTLQLTPAEAKKFWPVYDEYQRNLDMTNRRRVVAIQQLAVGDAPESEIYAKRLVNELIVVDEAEVKARRALQNRLMRAVPSRILPPKKVARYLQLESKIRAVQAYDVAATVPLIK
jgi:hypothetical protein